MTRQEMQDHSLDLIQLLHTHHVEAIQHLCDIGLTRYQARKILLCFARKGSYLTAECWNTLRIQDLHNCLKETVNGK